MKKAIIRLLVCFIPVPKMRRFVRRKLFWFLVYRPESLQKYKSIKEKWLIVNNGKKLLPGRYTEYDLVFAIGAACPMSWELIAHKLRTFSNPFDWTAGMPESNWMTDADVWRDSRFVEKIRALCADFVDFFNIEDIKMISNQNAQIHHSICNVRTKIRFMHLFPSNESVESVWDDVSAKIKRRGYRLIEKMKTSRRVLICWGHRMMQQRDALDAPVFDAEIKTCVKLLHEKFPNTAIDLVFFEHDGKKKEFEYDKIKVCEGAYKIVSNHYITTNDYKVVCEPIIFIGGEIYAPECLVIAEALDNIKLSDRCN